MITAFKNIFNKEPYYIEVDTALDRIKNGNSKTLCEEIRATLDKEKAQKIKCNLPSICFSGKFKKDRQDKDLIEHSGFIVLDFDNVENLRDRQTEIINHDFVYACWVSPSGNGLKALIRIADGKRHIQHFQALQDIFPDIDKSGKNVSRVCYESYDPDIYIYPDSEIFTKLKQIEKQVVRENVNIDEQTIFKNLLTWLTNKNEAFVSGERNNFIFKLASACCRFGINEFSAHNLIELEFLTNSEFPKTEADRAIRSAYKANANRYGDCVFEKEKLIEKISRSEIKVDDTIYDETIRPKDVIYGIDVKTQALDIYDKGYCKVDGINVPELDYHFKPKRGELTLLTGYGNAGKSTFKKWYQVMRILLYGEKFATFSPEDNPPEEYYHDFVEVLLGCDCTPKNPYRPNRETYERAYDFIINYVFYVYPKDVKPTPEYIKERFLELIIKERVDGCDIDPFNRMANDYAGFAGRDKYLEYVLADLARFAQMNEVYFWIIAHPVKAHKDASGNYPCPDVFDIADGAMWNNMTDNLLVYHRPLSQTEPTNPTCEFHAKKIRRQKTVGKRGDFMFQMKFDIRRFIFDTLGDPLEKLLRKKEISFGASEKQYPVKTNTWLPYKDANDNEELPF